MPSVSASIAVAATLLIQPVFGHLSMWHPAAYGYDAKTCWEGDDKLYSEPVNTDFLRNPLRLDQDLTFDQWWFHGCRRAPPKNGAVLELPAGGKITAEISCNKAFTSYGLVPSQLRSVGNLPCDINLLDGIARYGNPLVEAANGPLHTASRETAAGCSLSIAYKSDIYDVTAEDLVVISTNAECPWTRDVEFEIPADLPPCPNGKCICAWNWSHGASHGEGYANEIYMTGLDCNVVGGNVNAKIAKPKVAKECKSNQDDCVIGAKQGLYWEGAQKTGWNIPNTSKPNLPMLPPTYNTDWGFKDGAQNDTFESVSAPATQTESKPVAEPQQLPAKQAVKTSEAQTSSTQEAEPVKEVETTPAGPTGPIRPDIVIASMPALAIFDANAVEEVITVTQTHTVVLTANEAALATPQRRSRRQTEHFIKRRLIHGST